MSTSVVTIPTGDERVVRNVELSPAMRYALTTRTRVRQTTANALANRGLAQARIILGGWGVILTEAGRAARDGLLAPLVPGARIRHTQHGRLGRVVRVDLSENYDVVVLRWDGWSADTAGSPAYLEVIPDDEPTVEKHVSGAATLDEYMPGTTRQQQHDAGNHETCLRGECDELHPDRPCGFRWVAEIESCPRCGLSAASHDQDWPSAVTDRPAWRDELDAQVREVPLAVVQERESRSVSAHLRRARVLVTLLGAAEFAGVPDFTGVDTKSYGDAELEIQIISPEDLALWAGLLGVDRVVVEHRNTFVRVAVDATMHGMPVRCWDHLTDDEQGERMHSWAVAHGVTAQDWTVDSEFSLTVPEYLAALAATRQG